MRLPCAWTLPLLFLPVISVLAHDQRGEGARIVLKSTRDQASYAIGLRIGRDLTSNGLELTSDALLRGIRDAVTNADPVLSQEKCDAALRVFQRESQAKLAEQRRVEAAANQKTGDAFLAANGKEDGVVVLPSGLQYRVLKSGNGPSPQLNDTVRAHYHGTLIDGTVFDSSVARNKPEVFPVGNVIRGWTEAMQRMRVGSKWRLFVPSKLAYGPRGRGPTIGPNSVLVFDVELLGIE